MNASDEYDPIADEFDDPPRNRPILRVVLAFVGMIVGAPLGAAAMIPIATWMFDLHGDGGLDGLILLPFLLCGLLGGALAGVTLFDGLIANPACGQPVPWGRVGWRGILLPIAFSIGAPALFFASL